MQIFYEHGRSARDGVCRRCKSVEQGCGICGKLSAVCEMVNRTVDGRQLGYGRQRGTGKTDIENAWSGSAELGFSCCDDRPSVGLEFGHFPGKRDKDISFSETKSGAGKGTVKTSFKDKGDLKSFFLACSAAWRRDLSVRAFWYAGAGVGIARSRCSRSEKGTITWTPHGGVAVVHNVDINDAKSRLCFLGQAFTGLGVFLNENLQLTAGYRFRYLGGNSVLEREIRGHKFVTSVKPNFIHAAEVGLTYQF